VLSGEAGEQGTGPPGQYHHLPVLVELQRPAQAGFGLVDRPGQPRHFGLRHQELGPFRRTGCRRDQLRRLLGQPGGGAELAAPGEQLGPGCPPPALGVEVAGPGQRLAFLGQPQRLAKRPCA